VSTAIWVVVLIGLWVAVLLPAARRSHDSVSGLRSVDHFHGAMRVLSRREDRDRRWVVLPPGARTGRSGPPVGNHGPMRSRPTPPVRTTTLADRRRRTLLSLGATVVLSSSAVLAQGGLWFAPAALSWVALVIVVAWLRASAQAQRRARLARARARQRAFAHAVASAPSPWCPATGSLPLVGPTRELQVPSEAELAALPRQTNGPAESQILPIVGAQEWVDEPLSGVRVLDLGAPGGWRRTRLFESEDADLDGVDEEVPLRTLEQRQVG
jgi:hypothetical protein